MAYPSRPTSGLSGVPDALYASCEQTLAHQLDLPDHDLFAARLLNFLDRFWCFLLQNPEQESAEGITRVRQRRLVHLYRQLSDATDMPCGRARTLVRAALAMQPEPLADDGDGPRDRWREFPEPVGLMHPEMRE